MKPMNINHALVVFLFSFFLTSIAQAYDPGTDGRFGIGATVGSTSSVSGAIGLNQERALQMGVGTDGDALIVYGEHLWYFQSARLRQEIQPYIGLGAGIAMNEDIDPDDDEVNVDGRLPVGVSWFPEQRNFNIFGQLVPTVDVVDGNSELEANVGARILF